jgi:hypothetical protein
MTDARADWLPAAQQALETLAAALERADLEALLASERLLSDVAALVAGCRPVGPRPTPARRHQLETLRITLMRCRRLGISLSDVVRLSRAAQGSCGDGDVYGPHGTPCPAAPAALFETQV